MLQFHSFKNYVIDLLEYFGQFHKVTLISRHCDNPRVCVHFHFHDLHNVSFGVNYYRNIFCLELQPNQIATQKQSSTLSHANLYVVMIENHI